MSTIKEHIKILFKNLANERKNLGISIIIPLLVSLILCLFSSRTAISPYSFICILLCPLASCAFYIFEISTPFIGTSSKWLQLALAFSYGMSSYSLSNAQSVSGRLAYILLPLFVISLYQFLKGSHALPLLFAFIGFMLIDSTYAVSLFFVTVIYCIIFNRSKLGTALANLLHCALLFILSLLVTAPISFLRFGSFFETLSGSSYTQASFIYSPALFISRFFTGSLPSNYFENARNIDLRIGTILFILFVLFFFSNKIKASDRIRSFAFVLILFICVDTTPGLYLMDLFHVSNGSISQCGIVVFTILVIAGIAASHLSDTSPVMLFSGLGISFLSIAGALLLTAHNFSPVTLILQLILCAWVALFMILYSKKKAAGLFTLLSVSIYLDLLIGSACILSSNVLPNHYALNDQFIFSTKQAYSGSDTSSDASALKDWPYTDVGYENLKERIALPLYNTLNQVDANVSLEDSEMVQEKDGTYAPLSSFDEFNLKCHKIGIQEDVFTKLDDVSISFPEEYPDLYAVNDLGNHIYNIETFPASDSYEEDIFIPYSYTISSSEAGELYLYDNFTTFIIDCGEANSESALSGTSYIRMSQTAHFSLNVEINAYRINQEAFDQIPDALYTYMEEHQPVFSATKYIFYLLFMIIGLMTIIFFIAYNDIEHVNERLYAFKEKFADCMLFTVISDFCTDNRNYLLSFLIPFTMYIASMIIFSCDPFGTLSFLDCDGPSSVLGTFLNNYYSYKDGNFFLSMLGGYSNELTTTLAFPYYLLSMLFSPSQLPGLFIITEGILIGLSGFTMSYYLTHRFSSHKASKHDFRILFAAFIYSLNGFMLAMHSYVFWWYLLFCLFPLVVLQLENLIYNKKWLGYVILLSVCITTNFNIAFYICIYLVIHFFICKFDNIKDFIQKGVRFGAASILAAGCGLSGWAYVFSSKANSGYSATDSVLPNFGFHTSFFDQWSKLMIFSPTGAISHNDGDINIYMSIFMLLLITIFIFAKQIRLQKKLRLLVPMLFLIISFNGEVLSYIWNGLHYQSGVPNRYVFIWMFLCAILSYEALLVIRHLPFKRRLAACIIPIVFICACQFLGDGQKIYALVFTLVLLVVYVVMTFACKRLVYLKKNFYRIALVVLSLELFVNMLFVCHSYSLNNLQSFGDYEAKAEFNNALTKDENTFSRFSMANYYGMNFGFFNNAPTNQIFISTLNTRMQNMSFYYGFLSGGNYITSNYNSTPFGVSSSATKYITIPMYATVRQQDLSFYDYIGYTNGDYYFSNKDALSLGYYLPEDFAFDYYQENIIPYEAYNYTTCELTGDFSKLLFTLIPIQLKEQGTLAENEFQFLDKDFNTVSKEQAQTLLQSEEAQNAGTLSCQELYIKLNVTAPKNGDLYLYINEFISLGYAKKGETKSIIMKYPNQTFYDWDEYYCYSFDNDFYQEYVDAVKANQVENVTVNDNIITGESNYEKDGYTIFSVPYSDKWHAYIDGEEVDTYDLINANLIIKTPAGKHMIKLVYDIKNQVIVIVTSLAFYVLTFLIYSMQKLILKRKK